MDPVIIYAVSGLSGIGIVAAIILYLASKKFYVYEDPRIDEVEAVLPGANCGACGYAGCRNFAEGLVHTSDISQFHCPVGGQETMEQVAKILGQEVGTKEPTVAVVRCSGSYHNRKKTSVYDGVKSCAIASSLYEGETTCQYGCLGFGDCVASCDFDAIHMDITTGLPVVNDDNCTSCGACVEACPRNIIELRKRNKKDRKVYVSCINQEKGGVARKQCAVACIGCGKCVKVCPFDAITLENNLAYIDPYKCKLCRKCAPVCPTGAILEENFPAKRQRSTSKDTA